MGGPILWEGPLAAMLFDSFNSNPKTSPRVAPPTKTKQTLAAGRASYKAQHFKSLPTLRKGPLAAMFFDSFNSNPKTSPRVAPPTKNQKNLSPRIAALPTEQQTQKMRHLGAFFNNNNLA